MIDSYRWVFQVYVFKKHTLLAKTYTFWSKNGIFLRLRYMFLGVKMLVLRKKCEKHTLL